MSWGARLLIVAAGIGCAAAGWRLLPPESGLADRLRAAVKRSVQALFLAAVPFLVYALAVASAGDEAGALGFLRPLVDSAVRSGEAVFSYLTSPSAQIAIIAGGAAILALILFFCRRAATAFSWIAITTALFSSSFLARKEFGAFWIIVGAAGAAAVAATILQPKSEGRELSRRRTGIILALVLLFAALINYYRLDLDPRPFLDYEGTTGLSGIEVMEGNRDYIGILWSFIDRPIMNTYSVPFFAIPLAFLFRLFGVSVITLRGLAAFFGALTTVFAYALVSERRGRAGGVIAAAILALCPWHIIFSRVGLSLVLSTIHVIAVGWLLLRAFRTRSLACYALAGIGIGSYWLFYIVGKMIIPVAGLLIIHRAVLQKGFLRRHWPGILVLAATVVIIAQLSGLGVWSWLVGVGRQGPNMIWQRRGPDWEVTQQPELKWAFSYLAVNLQRTFRYLFIASHSEFLFPSRLALFHPLVIAFALAGAAVAVWKWKEDLNFFSLLLVFFGLLPQVLLAPFLDKAAPRHLMLLIIPFTVFAARPFTILFDSASAGLSRFCRPAAGFITAAFIAIFTLATYYITFATPRRPHKVVESRRDRAEFIRDNLDQRYFYIVIGPGPLYLHNRIIDFITYPLVGGLHYHLEWDFPMRGTPGRAHETGYAYVHPRDLEIALAKVREKAPGTTGFVFKDGSLVERFEEAFGPGAIVKKREDLKPWPYYICLP